MIHSPTARTLHDGFRRASLRRVALLCVSVLWCGALIGCGEEQEPVSPWTRLAVGRTASSVRQVRTAAVEVEAQDGVRLVATRDGTGDGLWMEATLRREDWAPGVDGVGWTVTVPCRGISLASQGDTAANQLVAGEHSFPEFLIDATQAQDYVPDGMWFRPDDESLILMLPSDELPPETATLRQSVLHGYVDSGGVARVQGRRYSGQGFAVMPGARVSLTVEVPDERVLRFATCAERLLTDPATQDEPLVFRVEVDGELLLEHSQAPGADGSHAWHELPLPAGAARSLVLSVEGPLAFGSFLAPVLAPVLGPVLGPAMGPVSEPDATRGENIVIFLADTFRADNLTAYGGTLGLTPHLDAFVAEGLAFERAWSTSTSTLPAHHSMFTGFQPRRTGANNLSRAVPETIETIAERLGDAGYRTGAITDSVMVSSSYGFDQGFEFFDEMRVDLTSTLERTRSFMEADDGRPVLLFVHTYRTHSPYHMSEETRAQYGEALGLDFPEESRELSETMAKMKLEELRTPVGEELRRKLRALYLGGTVDLDRAFHDFQLLRDEIWPRRPGFLLVTSDHGEAFGEHGPLEMYQSGIVWEEQLRVPLIVTGPGIEAGWVQHPVSLLDLAPTLADFAGIPDDDRWEGTSLPEVDRSRPLFA